VVLLGLRQRQLDQDAAHVLLHRPLGHPQPAGDPSVGPPLRHQRQHLPLPDAQHPKRVVAAAGDHQLGHQRRVHPRPAPGDPLQGVDELLHIGDAAFEQVPDPLAAGQQRHRVLDLHVGRQHQDGGLGVLLADLLGGLQTLGGVGGWHADVDHHQLRRQRIDQGQQLGGVAGLADHLETGAFQQAGQALPQQHVILSQNHPHPGRGL
jgi:hypothetical protein